ncbi:Olfactory receptor 7A10 [Sciurus carolinensis]|uniref:Olfactory receptor 7A10 n=1 Tax=Sciurus carolinensis TaxID=30640 RepID=A0AA41MJW9_SCICA|nr:Olfactory receptor 7A10 [Sciurus carolinensis]
MYLVTVLGNLIIILTTISDSHLHTPMSFFLSNLSFVDICFTSTTIPKMLVNIQTRSKAITYKSCVTQMHFFLLFAGLDIILLTTVAYDRFVAICHPLHYTVIMNPSLCGDGSGVLDRQCPAFLVTQCDAVVAVLLHRP